VDRRFKRRKGFAKDNLMVALQEYSKLKMQQSVESD